MAETSAKERLIALLGYCKELTTLHASDAKPTLELKSDDETTVLHETSLKRLQELKRTNGQPVLWLPEGGAGGGGSSGGVWMKLARPDDEDTRKTPLGQAACAAYAQLFSAQQEALREGRGAQLTVGVGLVRWQAEPNLAIDHPLVQMPAELSLDAGAPSLTLSLTPALALALALALTLTLITLTLIPSP